MIKYIIFLSFISFIYAFEPCCSSCKFFIPHNSNIEFGLCKMFSDKVYKGKEERIIYNMAAHCRSNENLCGNPGFLYESNDSDKITEKIQIIENFCSGEINEEKDIEELEKLEKELIDVFQKIRKHNTKRVYKTTKELYKLFKRNN